MKVTELRIGNFFSGTTGSGEEDWALTCHGVSPNDGRDGPIVWYSKELGFYLNESEITPIALTTEWLSNFGFRQWGSYKALWKTDASTECTVRYMSDGDFRLNEDMRVRIKYVHQLQNLYFALTGKELITTE